MHTAGTTTILLIVIFDKYPIDPYVKTFLLFHKPHFLWTVLPLSTDIQFSSKVRNT